jgi:2-polyprenyl-6-methoxyphenol hydroxylase-like FAD-dependent oxidoreductase
MVSHEVIEQARRALHAGDTPGARAVLPAASDDPDVEECLARAAYLELDFQAASEHWQRAYAGYRARGDTYASVRVARSLAPPYSLLARAIGVDDYNTKPMLQWSYYTYWSGLPVDGMETVIRPYRGWGAVPTNDDLTLIVMGWPYAEASAYKADVEANYLKTFDLAPEFGERVRAAKREARFAGGAVSNYFRKPFGPGWALIGDAGYNKDPITCQGITDAFHDVERCTDALVDVYELGRTFDDAMSEWQRARDEQALPIYEFTTNMATLEPPPPELQQLFGAMQGNQAAMNDFVSIVAATMSPVDFFDPEYIGKVMAMA